MVVMVLREESCGGGHKYSAVLVGQIDIDCLFGLKVVVVVVVVDYSV